MDLVSPSLCKQEQRQTEAQRQSHPESQVSSSSLKQTSQEAARAPGSSWVKPREEKEAVGPESRKWRWGTPLQVANGDPIGQGCR